MQSQSPNSTPFCQLGSDKNMIDGVGEEQASMFCNVKSGLSMLQAMQGAPQRADSSQESSAQQLQDQE